MPEYQDFVDSWQFRTAMVGAFIAALGIASCLLGFRLESSALCSTSLPLIYAGDAVGFFGVAAGVVTLGWSFMQRRRARDR